jgi:hypothetical protein
MSSKRAPVYEDIVRLMEQNGLCGVDELIFVFNPWPGTEIHLDGERKYRIYVNGKLVTDDKHPGEYIVE